MPITALQGYDGRAFETASVNSAGSILTLTRGDGTSQDIAFPAGGTGGGVIAPQTGPGAHYLNVDGGGLWANFAGIKSLSFWMRSNGQFSDSNFLADGRMSTGAGYFYSAGCGTGMHATIDGTAVTENNVGGAYRPLDGSGWHLVYLENICAADGLKVFSNKDSSGYPTNVDVADFRVYSRAWTTAEKANITAANVPTDALLGRYDFTNTSATQAIDQSGNATKRNLTFTGTTPTPI